MKKGDLVKYIYNHKEYRGKLYSFRYTKESSIIDTLGEEKPEGMVGRFVLIQTHDLLPLNAYRIKCLPYEQGII